MLNIDLTVRFSSHDSWMMKIGGDYVLLAVLELSVGSQTGSGSAPCDGFPLSLFLKG